MGTTFIPEGVRLGSLGNTSEGFGAMATNGVLVLFAGLTDGLGLASGVGWSFGSDDGLTKLGPMPAEFTSITLMGSEKFPILNFPPFIIPFKTPAKNYLYIYAETTKKWRLW